MASTKKSKTLLKGVASKKLAKKTLKALGKHAAQLMRINTEMLEGTLRVLIRQNDSLRQQLAELTVNNVGQAPETRSTKKRTKSP